MAKFKNKNNLDCCGDTTRGLLSAHPARSPHSEGPILQSAFLCVQMQPSQRKWQDQTRMSSTAWGGTCPRVASLQGLLNPAASQLSSSTIGLTHNSAASWFTWNNTELPNNLVALTAISIKTELFALLTVPFFPTPQLLSLIHISEPTRRCD